MADLDLLRRIDEQIIAATSPTRDVRDVGPFRLMIDPSTDLVYLNYAVPTLDGPLAPSIGPMIEAFRGFGRSPRLEFRAELWPGLAHDLEAAGFTLEAEQPVLICIGPKFVPRGAPDVEVEILDEYGDVPAYCRVADKSFGGIVKVDEERVRRTRRSIAQGNSICALGRIGGAPAGCACITPYKGVCELAGVGTIPRFRRRGIASAVSSRLMEEHFKTGDLVWLSAGDDTSRAVYEGLGFFVVATQKNYILPG